jgi:excisionase family DNA binding protein
VSPSRPPATWQQIGALLTEVARSIERVDDVPAEHVAAWLCQVAALQTGLAARWLRDLHLAQETARDRDRLLSVEAAAERLACSKDWLYRHHHRLPFAVKNGRQLRFSAEGLDRYIRTQASRERPSLAPGSER